MVTYQHIIWDWNGTLIDDTDTCVAVVNEILTQYGKPPTTQDFYLRYFDFPVADFYIRLGFDFQREDYDQLAQDYIAIYRQRQLTCPLQPGVPAVLSQTQAQGLGQSILSAYQTDLLSAVVGHFGLTDYFQYIEGLDNLHAANKTDQGHALLRKLQIPPEQVLLVGDTTHDCSVATTLGIDCVLIGRGHQHIDRLYGHDVPVLDSLNALPAYLGLNYPQN